MSEVSSNSRVSIMHLILVPALISLGVTILRLVGELKNWSSLLFNPEAGGGGALVGIAWLVPIFGIYFGLKLAKLNPDAPGGGRIIAYACLGLVAFTLFVFLARLLQLQTGGQLILLALASLAITAIQFRAWPAFAKALLAYGVAARIPVVLVMLFAILGNWGTHYDAPPPDLPQMGAWARFFWIGLLPQLTFWIAYTVVIGALFGGIAKALLSLVRSQDSKMVEG
ncbi:hypothetical protein MYX65_06065 [Acidobacteria bacterium AH-259-L09]|nr:hypothetical protein [Acidobacteria bacterium AH-259-L09]